MKRECSKCERKGMLACPESILCYSKKDKPFFEAKKVIKNRVVMKYKLITIAFISAVLLTLLSYIWSVISIVKLIF